MKISKLLILVCSLFITQIAIAQSKYLEANKRPYSIVQIFENSDCQHVKTDTMKMPNEFPFFFRTTIVQGTLVERDFHRFEVYFQKHDSAQLYIVRKGNVRGVSLSFPMNDRGIYWVRYFSHYPSLMKVDNRTSDILITWGAGCNILHN